DALGSRRQPDRVFPRAGAQLQDVASVDVQRRAANDDRVQITRRILVRVIGLRPPIVALGDVVSGSHHEQGIGETTPFLLPISRQPGALSMQSPSWVS